MPMTQLNIRQPTIHTDDSVENSTIKKAEKMTNIIDVKSQKVTNEKNDSNNQNKTY